MRERSVRQDVSVRLDRSHVATAVVLLLVLVSTGARFAAAQLFTIPWIAPDEMLYALLGESLWSDGTLTVRGAASPKYSLLTPALVGAALTGRDLGAGLELAQLLQTAVMSSAAIPVYLWCRRLASAWWAFGAAALAVAGPVLVYSGLLMTEALYYATCVWALYALSAALERPTLVRQGIFVGAVTVAAAVRMQALLLLPAFALAAVLYGVIGRDAARVRRVAPLTAGIVLGCAALLVLRLAAPALLGSDDLLGAYATVGESTVSRGIAKFVVWHLVAIALAALVIPFVALCLLAVEAFAGRVSLLPVQAYVATAVAYLPLLVLQVSVFVSGRLDHVSERYVITALPVLAIGFASWVSAGAPRRRNALIVLGLMLAALVALTPFDRVVPATAMQDALSSAALARLSGHVGIARLLLVAIVVLGVLVVALCPRLALPAVLAVLVVALAVGSIESTRLVARLSDAEQVTGLGSGDRRWLDRSGLRGVTLLATGDRPVAADARTIFWNRAIAEVLRLPDVTTGVPPGPATVTIDENRGTLRTADGAPLTRELVAAPDTFALDGDQVAQLPAGGAPAPGLAVWRTAGPVRIASRRIGFLPNGDVTGEVFVVVPGCTRGTLELTLIGKGGAPMRVTVNGVLWGTVDVPAGETVRAAIPAPRYADGSHACTFGLHVERYMGTTRVEFVPTSH